MRIIFLLVIVFLPFILISYLGFAQESVSSDEIIVDNSGSTNFSGYRMVIEASGDVTILPHGRVSLNSVYSQGKYKAAAKDIQKLVNDIDVLMPFSSIKSVHCFKSVSFGTSMFITYKGQTSPDIECMENHEVLMSDIYKIMGTVPRLPGVGIQLKNIGNKAN